MISDTYAVTGAAIATVGPLAVLVSRWAVVHFGPEPDVATEAPVAEPGPDARLPCHTTVCAHMTTAHDRTPDGLVCRGCGATTQEEAHHA